MVPNDDGSVNDDGLLCLSGGAGGGGGGGDGGFGGGGGGATSMTTSGKTLKKGPWTTAEDAILVEYVRKHGEGNWNAVQRNSGLARCGKSCRLRWANHLRPNLKKGAFTPDEERIIFELHARYGNKWARMATHLPGRTDNEIKNFWNTRVKRRLRQGLPLYPLDIHPVHSTNAVSAAAYSLQNALISPRALHHQSPLSPSLSLPTHLSSPHHQLSSATPISSPHSLSSPHHHHHHLFLPSPTLSHSPLSPPPHPHTPIPHSPPILSPPLYRFGRLRNTGAPLTPSIPHSQPPVAPSPILSSPLSTPLSSQMSTPQLSPIHFEPKSPPAQQTQFRMDEIGATPGLGLVLKPEFPSNQIFQTMPISEPMKTQGHQSSQGDGGLLDDLLKEAQTMVGIRAGDGLEDQKRSPTNGFGSWFSDSTGNLESEPIGHWNDSSSVHSSAGAMKMNEEAGECLQGKEDEDLTDLLINAYPFGMKVPDWCSSSGDELNGQSSGLTDDSGVVKTTQHPQRQPSSSLSTDNASCSSWSYMPRIC